MEEWKDIKGYKGIYQHVDFDKSNNSTKNLRLISHYTNSIRTRKNLPYLYRRQKTKENLLRHVSDLVSL